MSRCFSQTSRAGGGGVLMYVYEGANASGMGLMFCSSSSLHSALRSCTLEHRLIEIFMILLYVCSVGPACIY